MSNLQNILEYGLNIIHYWAWAALRPTIKISRFIFRPFEIGLNNTYGM